MGFGLRGLKKKYPAKHAETTPTARDTSAIANCVLIELISDCEQCPAQLPGPGPLSMLYWPTPLSPKYVSLAKAATATPVKIHAMTGGPECARAGIGAVASRGSDAVPSNRTLSRRFFSPARTTTCSSIEAKPAAS
jgi:hypothetical protein